MKIKLHEALTVWTALGHDIEDRIDRINKHPMDHGESHDDIKKKLDLTNQLTRLMVDWGSHIIVDRIDDLLMLREVLISQIASLESVGDLQRAIGFPEEECGCPLIERECRDLITRINDCCGDHASGF